MPAHGRNQTKEDAKMKENLSKLKDKVSAFYNRNWESLTPEEFSSINGMLDSLSVLVRKRGN